MACSGGAPLSLDAFGEGTNPGGSDGTGAEGGFGRPGMIFPEDTERDCRPGVLLPLVVMLIGEVRAA